MAELSIQLANFAQDPQSWNHLFELARAADRAGLDRVVVADHIVYGENLEAYGDPKTGGSLGGKQPTTPDGHWLEPLTLLSVIAGQTTRVRLGTAILLAALRPAAVLAKQLATLDVLSGGRLDVGVGVGWQREEYEVVGLDFASRGRMLDQTLELCQRLWTEQTVVHRDGQLLFDRIHQMPKPVAPEGVPIWVSGRNTAKTVARVTRFGVGWIPWGDDIADPRPGIAAIKSAWVAADRDPGALKVQGTLPVVRSGGVVDIVATVAGAAPLVEAGVTDFRFQNRWGVNIPAETELLEAIVPAFKAATG